IVESVKKGIPIGSAPMADVLTDKRTSSNREVRMDMRTLYLAQKTELIGELTRVMANQFNNTMMAITSYAELEMKKAAPSQRRSLEQVLSSTGRATALIQQLLAITRKQTTSPQRLDLNAALTRISSLIEQIAGEGVSVAYQLESDSLSINADLSELEQVVLSLAISACNAMAKSGTLTISTKLIDLGKESFNADAKAQPGKYVLLSIDDTGRGRSQAELDFRLTESPDPNSRISMSLAAIHGMVQNAGGWVRLDSQPVKGSSFKIYFPLMHETASAVASVAPQSKSPVARTILVVEDDDAVRLPATEFLKMEGFKVLQARTGAEAINVVLQIRSRLDLLITDIVMPKMNGHEVAETLKELHPDLKVLYMSGDTDEVGRSQGDESGKGAVLRKPFRLDTLKSTIHKLLSE